MQTQNQIQITHSFVVPLKHVANIQNNVVKYLGLTIIPAQSDPWLGYFTVSGRPPSIAALKGHVSLVNAQAY